MKTLKRTQFTGFKRCCTVLRAGVDLCAYFVIKVQFVICDFFLVQFGSFVLVYHMYYVNIQFNKFIEPKQNFWGECIIFNVLMNTHKYIPNNGEVD